MTRELACSWSLRAHYSDDLALSQYGPGREGTAICGRNTTVYDSEAINVPGRPRPVGEAEVTIARRPLCKRCAAGGPATEKP